MISGRRTLFKLYQFQDNMCGHQYDLENVHDTHLKENQSWGPRQYWQCKIHLHRNDLEVDRSAEGNYSTELYGAKAAQIIRWKILIMWQCHLLMISRDHNQEQPLFLYLPFQAVHGPLQVPQKWVQIQTWQVSAIHQVSNRMHSYWCVQARILLWSLVPGMKRCMQTCRIVTGKLTWEWWLLWMTPLERSLLLSRRLTCEQTFLKSKNRWCFWGRLCFSPK